MDLVNGKGEGRVDVISRLPLEVCHFTEALGLLASWVGVMIGCPINEGVAFYGLVRVGTSYVYCATNSLTQSILSGLKDRDYRYLVVGVPYDNCHGQ